MNFNLIRQLVSNADESDIEKMLEHVDVGQVLENVGPVIDSKLSPHFDYIRERAQQEDPKEAQEFYSNLSEEKQQQQFDATVAELIAVIRECRENPEEGFPMLRERLRDPDVLEPMLLIFENPDHIDPEYSEEMKKVARYTVRWAGASVMPEIYTQSEIEDLERRLSE